MTRSLRAPALMATVALFSGAVLVGCSKKTDGAAKTAGTQASTPAQSGARASTTNAGSSKVATVDPNKVIARQTFKLRKNPEDTVEVGIVSLTASAKITTLQLVFTPHFKSMAATEAVDIFSIFERDLYRPYLLDLDHLKRYDVVRGTNSSTFSSDEVSTKTVNGTPMAAYAVFAAPQDGATAFDVHIADWWPEFKAVPVQR